MPQPKRRWTAEEAEIILSQAGLDFGEPERTGNGLGTMFRTTDGRIILVYDTGSLVCQGKLSAATKALFEGGVVQPSGKLPIAGAGTRTTASSGKSVKPRSHATPKDVLTPAGAMLRTSAAATRPAEDFRGLDRRKLNTFQRGSVLIEDYEIVGGGLSAAGDDAPW
ncbi:hypothetical protein AA23498_2158 [Acetobacter nitrogenifigens DSM 23921 = NBRC 105050]|uniref:Uncharacterized protein n=1 Tax=Acetobacter nitrogenifigens DSM 23921 = NBRC 105050 TaxID=1120919 RepID=A0A511X6V2_9PROT|nr:hypothetical protein [Acetobacter nitrogenifigens]GBQ94960.1 hypothetical protein AA23498_2158 [Acetobacter nitrogenifigens DSM 23921 = NBRC 105050]GEN58662.1 hypothetical protein ANI02nite_05460 [Acetobacter nitrogenifigens DSM 23921 = NBRC 105050]